MEEISSRKAMSEHKKLKSHWSPESSLTQKILISILAKMERQEASKKRRKPSEWNRFLARELKKGKSMKDISAEWKEMSKLPAQRERKRIRA